MYSTKVESHNVVSKPSLCCGGGGWGFFRNLGSSTELLLLHFSSFTIGRRLDVTVASEEEKLLQPSKPYCPLDNIPNSAVTPSHVITVSAPRDAPRYEGCCWELEPSNSDVLSCPFCRKRKEIRRITSMHCYDITRGFFLLKK